MSARSFSHQQHHEIARKSPIFPTLFALLLSFPSFISKPFSPKILAPTSSTLLMLQLKCTHMSLAFKMPSQLNMATKPVEYVLQMASGVHFSLFHSKVLGTPDFPLERLPLQTIVRQIEDGAWNAKPAATFDFEQIQAAHVALDAGRTTGKIVVRL